MLRAIRTTLRRASPGAAWVRNPMLQATRAAAEAVAARQPSATLPPDPEIRLGVMKASLPGLRTDMPGAMFPSVEMMQMVPLPDRLRLAGEIARRNAAIARTEVDEDWWETRARVAMPFYEVHRPDRQIGVMEETLD